VTHDPVVVVEQVAPSTVAEQGGPFGGGDDVGEHDRGEHPLGGTAAYAGDELLDLVEHRRRCRRPSTGHPAPGSSTRCAPAMRSAM
jgi:hypothetical protein